MTLAKCTQALQILFYSSWGKMLSIAFVEHGSSSHRWWLKVAFCNYKKPGKIQECTYSKNLPFLFASLLDVIVGSDFHLEINFPIQKHTYQCKLLNIQQSNLMCWGYIGKGMAWFSYPFNCHFRHRNINWCFFPIMVYGHVVSMIIFCFSIKWRIQIGETVPSLLEYRRRRHLLGWCIFWKLHINGWHWRTNRNFISWYSLTISWLTCHL